MPAGFVIRLSDGSHAVVTVDASLSYVAAAPPGLAAPRDSPEMRGEDLAIYLSAWLAGSASRMVPGSTLLCASPGLGLNFEDLRGELAAVAHRADPHVAPRPATPPQPKGAQQQ